MFSVLKSIFIFFNSYFFFSSNKIPKCLETVLCNLFVKIADEEIYFGKVHCIMFSAANVETNEAGIWFFRDKGVGYTAMARKEKEERGDADIHLWPSTPVLLPAK